MLKGSSVVVLHLDEVEAELIYKISAARPPFDSEQSGDIARSIYADVVQRLVEDLQDEELMRECGIDASRYSDYLHRKQAEEKARMNKASRERWARLFPGGEKVA